MVISQNEENEFISKHDQLFKAFQNNHEKNLISLDPMNSYCRRLIHQLITKYDLKSYSEGEGKKRHIVITKGDVPQEYQNKNIVLGQWDWGNNEFSVKLSLTGIDIALDRKGNFGLMECCDQRHLLDQRRVTTGSFKIKKNKILEDFDLGWL